MKAMADFVGQEKATSYSLTITREKSQNGDSSIFAPHCNENPIYVFLFLELRGLSPNFHIHVCVSDLYIPRLGPHIPAAE
jgi:hypothetical protein